MWTGNIFFGERQAQIAATECREVVVLSYKNLDIHSCVHVLLMSVGRRM